MLESTLEILQQFYIQMETEPHDFLLFPGDSSLYTLRCIRCPKPVTVAGSIEETLFHAPTAMLYHWNIIQFHNKKLQRINVDATTFHLLRQLFTIIKIFSSTFELD
jgi:hypothetical protein